MNIAKRFNDGLNIGLLSFGLLWEHKKLLLYLSIPKLLAIAVELAVHNLFFASPVQATLFLRGIMSKFFYYFGGMQHLLILFIEMVTILVTIFAGVALTYHAFALLKKRVAGVKRSIKLTVQKIKPIILWMLISTVVYLLIGWIDLFAYPCPENACDANLFFATVAILARVAWALAFLFVIPLIALEEKPLRDLVRKSIWLFKKIWIQYAGAMFWVGLIGLLGIAPLYLVYPATLSAYGITYVVLAILTFTISTVHAIVKTVLYKEYGEG